MAKDKEPKRLCRCGCGKWISARAERRHRDGQVPPRIAAVQKSKSKVSAGLAHLSKITASANVTSTPPRTSHHHNVNTSDSEHRRDNISMEEDSDRVPSPMDYQSDNGAGIEPTTNTPVLNTSVNNARAAVWNNWRPQRKKATDSDDEEKENTGSSHKSSVGGIQTVLRVRLSFI